MGSIGGLLYFLAFSKSIFEDFKLFLKWSEHERVFYTFRWKIGVESLFNNMMIQFFSHSLIFFHSSTNILSLFYTHIHSLSLTNSYTHKLSFSFCLFFLNQTKKWWGWCPVQIALDQEISGYAHCERKFLTWPLEPLYISKMWHSTVTWFEPKRRLS